MAQKTKWKGSEYKYDPVLKRPIFNCDFPSSYHDGRIAKQIFVRIKKNKKN